MTTHTAYCVPCDIELDVVLEEGQTEVTADRVRCPGLGQACHPESCLLRRLSPARVRAHLDFLPPTLGQPTGRGFEEAARLVEFARRRSLGREARCLRRWWREANPRS